MIFLQNINVLNWLKYLINIFKIEYRVSTLSTLLLCTVAPQTSFKTFNTWTHRKGVNRELKCKWKVASGNGVYPFLFLWFRINFNFCNKSAKNFFSPLPFSLMPCDSLNCRHSDAAADVDVAVAVGFAVYRTFLALPLHTLGRAQKISLGARFETMTNMQIYVVAGWQTWQRNQTDKLRAKTRTKQTRSERSRSARKSHASSESEKLSPCNA